MDPKVLLISEHMKKLLIVFALIAAIPANALNWYFVSPSGSDSNVGTSSSAPWQTINKVNSTPLSVGDEVYFQGGQTFQGNLELSNIYGGSVQRIYISSYGTGNATIRATTGNAIDLNNSVYVVLAYINVQGPGWNLGALNDDSRGVNFSGATSHCVIDHVSVTGFHTAGISMGPSTHDNWATNDSASQNGRIGMWIEGNNQIVENCYADNNYGDLVVTNNWSGTGIVADTGSYITIEYCEASGNGSGQPFSGNGPVGIWCWYADHVYIGHCVSHDNHRGRASTDGGGFDFDGGTTNSIIEYCQSYNNDGAGYMIYNFNWNNIQNSGNTIRYSTSQNDAIQGMQAIVFGSSGIPLSNNVVYGTTIINTDGREGTMYNGTYTGVAFTNNIWMTAGPLYRP
jgi:hypothetical protein